MAAISITFNCNDIKFRYTTVTVYNAFKARKTELGDGKFFRAAQDIDEGYVLRNKDVMDFIRAILDKLPYLKYSRVALQDFSMSLKTLKIDSFSLQSNTSRLYKSFIEIWEDYLDNGSSE